MLFDVLCDSTETLNTELFCILSRNSYLLFIQFMPETISEQSNDHVCFDFEQSRQMSSCFFIPVPCMTSNTYAYNPPHVCTNYTILMHKDKAKTFSLHVNTVTQTQIKACIEPQKQDRKVSLDLSLKLMGRHSANQTKMSCNSVQSSTRTYNYILTHINKQTYFSPGL